MSRPSPPARRRFVEWFRGAAPYIYAHRGRTFVVAFEGEALLDEGFAGLIHDFALLQGLGVRLVLVHGVRPQIDARLAARGLGSDFVGGLRITDARSLEAVKEAVGAVRVEIESLLSMGVANSPMAGARIRVASGNFVVARPIGVRDGVDYAHTGEVRRIDRAGIETALQAGNVVLVSPLGYSPTGEVFNLSAEEVATALAVELRAAKLVFLLEGDRPRDESGAVPAQLTVDEARHLLARRRREPHAEPGAPDLRLLAHAVHACRNGVRRSHLVERRTDGALLLELYTRDGLGTMVNADPYDAIRRATIEDVGGILELITPLEREGVLVRRDREKLETEIERFIVAERDRAVIACACIAPFPAQRAAELACVAVADAYRRGGVGDALLAHAEAEARAAGAERLFVLTTHAIAWFKERGFADAAPRDLPPVRLANYDPARNSRVLVKRL